MQFLRLLLIAALAVGPTISMAQGFKVAFGEMQQDSSLPVEVTADNLSVNQNDGSAVFSGNVDISQGEMRMTADKVNVFYNSENRTVARLLATGDVLVAQGKDVAEADMADYSIAESTVKLSGNVMVVQESSTITADEMFLNLAKNTAEMQGRVKTVLRSE